MNQKMDKRKKHSKAGFTLIEILLVVVIIVILAGVAAPKLINKLGGAQDDAAFIEIGAISTAVELYVLDTGEYPSSLQNLSSSSGKKGWDGPYLKKGDTKDPWGNEYKYSYPGSRNQGDFDLWTTSKDGKEIGNWENP